MIVGCGSTVTVLESLPQPETTSAAQLTTRQSFGFTGRSLSPSTVARQARGGLAAVGPPAAHHPAFTRAAAIELPAGAGRRDARAPAFARGRGEELAVIESLGLQDQVAGPV